MRRLAAILSAILAAAHGVLRAIFPWAYPTVDPAPDGEDAVPAQAAAPEERRPTDEDPLPLGHAIILKAACRAVAEGGKPDADRLAKLHPALSGWVKNLTPDEAAKAARETCATIRRHVTGHPCIEGVPGVGQAASRHLEAVSTELGRRLQARRAASSPAPADDEARSRRLATIAF